MSLQCDLLREIRRHDGDSIGHSTIARSINKFLHNRLACEISTIRQTTYQMMDLQTRPQFLVHSLLD